MVQVLQRRDWNGEPFEVRAGLLKRRVARSPFTRKGERRALLGLPPRLAVV
jgi:hypothetical protein